MSDETIVEADDAFLTMIGHARDSVIGHSPAELGLWRSFGGIRTHSKELRERGRIENVEIELCRGSRETIHVLTSIERVEAGGETRTLSFFNDITERKRIADSIPPQPADGEHWDTCGRNRNDLNNALAPILMSAELLRMKSDDPEILQTLDVLEASAKRERIWSSRC